VRLVVLLGFESRGEGAAPTRTKNQGQGTSGEYRGKADSRHRSV